MSGNHACSCGHPRVVVTALRSGTTWLRCLHCDAAPTCNGPKPEGEKPACPHCWDLMHAEAKQ